MFSGWYLNTQSITKHVTLQHPDMVEAPLTKTPITSTTKLVYDPSDSQKAHQNDLQDSNPYSDLRKVEELKTKYSPDTEAWLAKRKVFKEKTRSVLSNV